MEAHICIYCQRTLEVSQLSEKAGKYRCKNENDCLDYQTKEDPIDSVENAEYISSVVSSSLLDAAQRIAVYKKTRDDQAKSNVGKQGQSSQDTMTEFAWMKRVLDALASKYKEKNQFVFQYDDTKNNEYSIAFSDADRHLHFLVKIDRRTAVGYSLTVSNEAVAANADHLYQEFIYRRYPDSEQEEVIKDISVILVAFEEDTDCLSALLNEFRIDIASRDHQR